MIKRLINLFYNLTKVKETPLERLNRLIQITTFRRNEFFLGLVPDADGSYTKDEKPDTYALERFLIYSNRLEKLKELRLNYSF